jgi:disulfide bond formation protein DsbB
MENTNNSTAWYLIFFAWLIALVSTLGSLFFSEIMHFPPCSLCWYQRIFMYPLVFVLFMGLFPLTKQVFRFSIPLVLAGLFFSIYHNLLHFEIIPESATPCSEGISCSAKYIEWGGIITIPLLSFVSFTILFILLMTFYKKFYKEL